MIRTIGRCTYDQKRDVTPIYPNINEMNYKDWGKPKELRPSEFVDLHLELTIRYDKDHAGLIKTLMSQVREVLKAADTGEEDVRVHKE